MITLKNVSKWYGHFQVLTDLMRRAINALYLVR